ncbi:hypothetical protein SAMN04488063_2081 [Halopelagius inordinatus]|uniref:DUF1684 domain-containing protein n=1 Tax=Halopelagius inordinatus TaxID=553467 RepID=A0A1I2RWG6_9EURY|nr:DUF1684 domain-containing protein [Halopelagius inordinatus]SFG44830.1 hypothetical protein SAMN04488063_2081 [Halopelagius inordinatus]
MSEDADATATDAPENYAETLREKRAEKDEFFGSHPQSPIPPELRDEFDGLDYFEPDPAYRVSATARVHEEPEPMPMETTAGNEVRYLRVVTFEFSLRGESLELHGYRQETGDEEALFVPFRDKTTGQQTYENGRYIELHPEGELDDGDDVTVDFNVAYNPFCVYSETFACPLPPEENWLEIAIPAGERTWSPEN